VVRFGERDGHTLFLEPESLSNDEMYLNGLATSLPFDVQSKMVKSISGLENAKIIRPGYGIEYDYFQPIQLHPTLESKIIQNLFFAGQINGTSGYEEAAGQGIVAGINAAQKILSEEKLILSRDSSYIGVLVDDLVTRGTEEPYRMFTSRAEYRLILRQDNCDERLMPIAYKLGYLQTDQFNKRKNIWEKKDEIINKLKVAKIDPDKWNETNEEENKISQRLTAFDLIKRPNLHIEEIVEYLNMDLNEVSSILKTIESDIKYEGFVQKQKIEIEKFKKIENLKIPDTIDYSKVQGLLTETQIKLGKILPGTLGQASRVSGVTPADISILAIYISKYGHVKVSRETMEVAYE
jgi:tRNA uridine 5-carboxymethylaminomethyl modification enzyme